MLNFLFYSDHPAKQEAEQKGAREDGKGTKRRCIKERLRSYWTELSFVVQAIFRVQHSDQACMVRSTSLEALPSCCLETSDEDEKHERARSSTGVHDRSNDHEAALMSKLSAGSWAPLSKSYQLSSVVRHITIQTYFTRVRHTSVSSCQVCLCTLNIPFYNLTHDPS